MNLGWFRNRDLGPSSTEVVTIVHQGTWIISVKSTCQGLMISNRVNEEPLRPGDFAARGWADDKRLIARPQESGTHPLPVFIWGEGGLT